MVHAAGHCAVFLHGQDDIVAAMDGGIFLRGRLKLLAGGIAGKLEYLPLVRRLKFYLAGDPAVFLHQRDGAVSRQAITKGVASRHRYLVETGASQVIVAQPFRPQRGVPVRLHRRSARGGCIGGDHLGLSFSEHIALRRQRLFGERRGSAEASALASADGPPGDFSPGLALIGGTSGDGVTGDGVTGDGVTGDGVTATG